MSPMFRDHHPPQDARNAALFGGFVSLVFVSGLWLWFGFTTQLVGNELFFLYCALGAAALGFVPTLLFRWRGLVAPLVTTVGFGAVAAYRTWAVYVAPATAPAPVDPTPFGWYLLGWVAVLGAGLLLAAGEQWLRRTGASHDESNPLD